MNTPRTWGCFRTNNLQAKGMTRSLLYGEACYKGFPRQIDLCVLDVMMPKKRRSPLHKNPFYKSRIPIISFSQNDEEDILEGFKIVQRLSDKSQHERVAASYRSNPCV